MRAALAALVIVVAVLPLVPRDAAADKLVVLVRHAEKEKGVDPVLTEAGKRRAEALADHLAEARIDFIITTQYRRTRLTAQPLAQVLGLEPIVIRPGDDLKKHFRDVATAVNRLPEGIGILVVGHSNTIPHIVTALGGPRLPDMDENDNSTMFILHLSGDETPRLIRAQFGEPGTP